MADLLNISELAPAPPETSETVGASEGLGEGAAGTTASPTDKQAVTGTDESQPPVKRDQSGVVWDKASHSYPPRMNARGDWRKRRGRKVKVGAAPAPPTPSQRTPDISVVSDGARPEASPPGDAPAAPPVALGVGSPANDDKARMLAVALVGTLSGGGAMLCGEHAKATDAESEAMTAGWFGYLKTLDCDSVPPWVGAVMVTAPWATRAVMDPRTKKHLSKSKKKHEPEKEVAPEVTFSEVDQPGNPMSHLD